jgi:hypothetical protein
VIIFTAAALARKRRNMLTERNALLPKEFGFDLDEEEAMSKKAEDDAQPEALATFAATARNKGVKPASQGISATAETSGKPGDLEAEEKDAADILGANATGDKKRVDAAIAHHAKTDKRRIVARRRSRLQRCRSSDSGAARNDLP